MLRASVLLELAENDAVIRVGDPRGGGRRPRSDAGGARGRRRVRAPGGVRAHVAARPARRQARRPVRAVPGRFGGGLVRRLVAGTDRGPAALVAGRDGRRRAPCCAAARARGRAGRGVCVRCCACTCASSSCGSATGRRRAAAGGMGAVVRAGDVADVRALPRAARGRSRARRRRRSAGPQRRWREPRRPVPAGTASRGSVRAARRRCSRTSRRARPRVSARSGSTRSARGSTSRASSPLRPSWSRRSSSSGSWTRREASSSGCASSRRGSEHPWGLTTAARCDALVRLAAGEDVESAAAELAHAADGLRLARPPLRPRAVLLSLGRAQRRLRKWGAARDVARRSGGRVRRAGLARLGA